MKHATIDPIGISAIDLLVCAFIALVVLNLLREEGDASPDRDVKGVDVLRIETAKDCPFALCLDFGGKRWTPDSRWPGITYARDDSDANLVRHQLDLRKTNHSGNILLFLYAEQERLLSKPQWQIKIAQLGRDTQWEETRTLSDNTAYRVVYRVR